MINLFLTFSDSAKFAQATFNLLSNRGMNITHSFFNPHLLESFEFGSLFPANFLPLPSWLLSLLFRFFPATDLSVALFGLVFFVLSSLLIFLIGRKLHSTGAGLVAPLFFLTSLFFQEYALNFASEISFVFLILLFIYFLLLPKSWKSLSVVPLITLFFARQQTPVFFTSFLISVLAAFLFSRASKAKKNLSVLLLGLIFILGIVVSRLNPSSILSPARIMGSFGISAGSTFGTYIRGGEYQSLSLFELGSKIFYNFYNFIKAPERLAFTPIFFLFIYSLFVKSKKKELKYFKIFTSVSLISFLLAASATLPNARYVHPIIPLVMISAAVGLVELVKNIPSKARNIALIVLSLFIIFPTIGHFTLDARARANQFNVKQPPVYRQISSVMADNIDQGHLIITNLDAWAAWYEGLTTMWFPLEIDMLVGYEDKVDYIVITNYKENDGDFALGDWRQVVYSPDSLENEWLLDNFDLLETFEITPEQVRENKAYQGTILVNKRLSRL